MRLRHTEFFGRFEGRSDVAGFSVARLRATTPLHEVAPHEHQDAHFVLVLAGVYRSSARDAVELLGPGDLVWNPPGTRHQDRFDCREGLFLALSLAAPQAQALGLGDGHAQRLRGAAAALALELGGHAGAQDLGGLLQAEEHCLQLCAMTAGKAPPRIRGEPIWLRRCMERLLDASAEPLRLGDVAEQAGVHPVSLARAFRRHYGVAPGQMQRRAQLNRAAALLRHGSTPAEAATACGFADQSHFTRLFRSEYRCTPAAWQRGFKTF
jgi:AraC family transcriptional regulator